MPSTVRGLKTQAAAVALCWVTAVFLGACSSGPAPKPDPTPEEWEHAVDETEKTVEPRPSVVEVAPRLRKPADGEVIRPESLEQRQKILVFTWSSSGPASSYTLEIATDPNFIKTVFSKRVPRNALAYRMRNEGVFFWRVRTDGGLSSNVQRFVVSSYLK